MSACLMKALKVVHSVLIDPLLAPDDDYNHILRKHITAVSFLMAFLALPYAAWFIADYAAGRQPVGSLVAGIAAVYWVLIAWPLYFYTRRTKTCPRPFVGVIMLLYFLTIIQTTIGDPWWRLSHITYAGLIVVAMGMPSGMFPLLGLGFLTVVVVHVNEVLLFEPDAETLLALSKHRKPSSVLAFALETIGGASMMWIAVLVVFIQSRTHLQLVRASKAGEDLSQAVASELQLYNTEAVQAILEEAEAEGQVNGSLVQSLRGITNNLENYRPFLPNYMFIVADSDAQEEQEKGSQSRRRKTDSAECQSVEMDDTEALVNSMLQISSVASEDDDLQSSAGLVASSPTPWSRGGSQTGEVDRDPLGHSSGTKGVNVLLRGAIAPPAARLSRGSDENSGSSALSTARNSFRRAEDLSSVPGVGTSCIAYVAVDFARLWAHSGSKCSKVMGESVFEIAKHTKGAVHSFVGDMVYLSWNATHRVIQPEVKASIFLVTLSHVVREASMPPFAAALCSGVATLASHTSTTRQQALFIHLPFRGRLEGCLALARSLQCTILDEESNVACCHHAVSRAVDVVRYRSAVSAEAAFHQDELRPHASEFISTLLYPSSIPLVASCCDALVEEPVSSSMAYQLFSEVERREDEWMYALQEQEEAATKNPALRTTAIIEALHKGHTSQAHELLQALLASLNSSSSSSVPASSTTATSARPKVRGQDLDDKVLQRLSRYLASLKKE